MPNIPYSDSTETECSPLKIEQHEKKFVLWLAIAFVVLVSLPVIYGYWLMRPGTSFIGFSFNTDDQMVYSAWMHQAMHGHFLFDNRFAIEKQPTQTIHLYYFVLGWLAKAIGISFASNLARILLAGLFVPILYYFVSRITDSIYTRKLSTILTLIGGGLGFLVWHNFGRALVIPHTLWMSPITQGILPTDVWQPEGFVFPSMLTNGLFAISLCLILSILSIILELRKNTQPRLILLAAILFGVLMNIHSYDALLITLILVGFLAASLGVKQAKAGWIFRVFLVGLGAVLPALWFVHVLKVDKVFADRAATPTFSADFRALVIGYLPLLVFGFATIYRGSKPGQSIQLKRLIGFAISLIVVLVLWVFSTSQPTEMLSAPQFAILFAATLVACFLLADESPVYNLLIAWALIGLISPYFPALFQRKLTMALCIPWAILAGIQVARLLEGKWRPNRNFASVFLLLIFGGSSVQWIFRQFSYINNNVSSTTVQPVYLNRDAQMIINYLNQLPNSRIVVMAIPGIPNPEFDTDGNRLPDSFGAPIVPDLNPILSGFAGVYTYAGHWSETPDYAYKREKSMKDLFGSSATYESGEALLKSTGTDYIIGVQPSSFPEARLNSLAQYGKVVIQGDQFELIKVNH